jgi:hypothetical protein
MHFFFDYAPGALQCKIPLVVIAQAAPLVTSLLDGVEDEINTEDAMEIYELIKEVEEQQTDVDTGRFLKEKAARGEAKRREEEKEAMDEIEEAEPKLMILSPAHTVSSSSWLPECPVCLELPLPPWSTMTCGHLICPACFNGLKKKSPKAIECPVCRKKVGDQLVPQLILADIVRLTRLTIACRYADCGKNLPYEKILEHHETCPHRDIECHEIICPWKGPLNSFADHLASQHDARLFDNPTSLSLDVRSLPMTGYIIWPTKMILIYLFHGDYQVTMRCASLHSDSQHVKIEYTENHLSGTWTIRAPSLAQEKWKSVHGVSFPYVQKKALSVAVSIADEQREPKKRKREEEEEEEEEEDEIRATGGEVILDDLDLEELESFFLPPFKKSRIAYEDENRNGNDGGEYEDEKGQEK